MSGELFLLRWEEFEANISCALQDLRTEEDLCDVTLVCEDGEVKAHKVILSACSTFFRRVVARTGSHAHPLLYLRGVTTKELGSILDFMYQGKVSVPQEELPAMLSLASDLQVRGLTDSHKPEADTVRRREDGGEEAEEERDTCLVVPAKKTARKSFQHRKPEAIKQKELVPADAIFECEDVDNVGYEDQSNSVEVWGFEDHEEEEEKEDTAILGTNLEAPPHDETNKEEILDAMVESICVRRSHYHGMGTVYECGICKKVVKKKEKMRCHAEKHIKGFSHQCVYCGKHYKTRPSMKVHISIAHKQERAREGGMPGTGLSPTHRLDL